MIDNFFIDFDVILNVAIKKYKYFDNNDSNIDVNIIKKIDEKTNEQLNATLSIHFDVKFRVFNIVAIFARFDVISNVATKKCDLFKNIDSNIDAKQNIDFDIAKKINEIDKTNKQMIIDFFLILYVNFDTNNWKFEFFDVLNEIDNVIDF